MMLKYTANNLKRLETLLNEAGYIIRYEKGNFVSGYCVLEHRKVLVINKYFDLEARIGSLIEIMNSLHIDLAVLSEGSKDFAHQYHLFTVQV